MDSHRSPRRQLWPLLALTCLAWVVWPWLASPFIPLPRTITIFGFSTLTEVMERGIFPAFERHWETSHGEPLRVSASFGSSGTIANQVLLGLPAQVVLLNTESDLDRISNEPRLRVRPLASLPDAGTFARSPMVIVTRGGNPHGISSFEDLGKSGVSLIHPDPSISGGAKWLVIAEYASLTHLSPESRITALSRIYRNISSFASSSRGALTQFRSGFGDAVVTFEHEVLIDRAKHRDETLIHPSPSLLADFRVTSVGRNIAPSEERVIDAFIAYLWSSEGQEILQRFGFRPATSGPEDIHPRLASPLSIESLGGWNEASRTIVKEVWFGKIAQGD